MSPPHCLDLTDDRQLGAFWERQFCRLAFRYGLVMTPNQIGLSGGTAAAWYRNQGTNRNKIILPDVTIWSAPAQHHEVKHKAPTRLGEFGLEAYRFNSLLRFYQITGQEVYYTIHNHAWSGGRYSTINKPEHWVTASIPSLQWTVQQERTGYSWINGEKSETNILYWKVDLFFPLTSVLRRESGQSAPPLSTRAGLLFPELF